MSAAQPSVVAAGAAEDNRKFQAAKDKMDADWTNLPKEHPLQRFANELPAVLESTAYREMYGVELQTSQPTPHTTLIILQKFLRANAGDLTAAKTQLESALTWRKTYKPLDAKEETFSAAKFGGLGYVTTLHGATETGNAKDIATFNIYGAAGKNPQATFGDTDAFVRWRVALMELTLAALELPLATLPIPDYGKGPDPYQAVQIHDYQSISFFRQPPEIRASSQKIISTFQSYYPETVSYKYFVNVPWVMQWMMGAMKALMSRDSIRKMTWMTSGTELEKYLGKEVAKEYGGSGMPLTEVGMTVKYDDGAATAEQTDGAGTTGEKTTSSVNGADPSVDNGTDTSTAPGIDSSASTAPETKVV